NILITTDLGSRGLDIDGVAHIIHYHLPASAEAYTHRNGRTARDDNDGEIFVITAPEESLPDYINTDDTFAMPQTAPRNSIVAKNVTLYFMAGKKEKISRGDIVGFIANNSLLTASEIGKIDVKDHYSLVAVPAQKAKQALSELSTCKIKNKKVKIGFAKVV
ncbi:MAG: DbpA RNA binding domain-containing protein, partial [Muribaculaceae bacterium]|nr:DbpA RNA binding domain-containing protein [Muribaculaceae bacterium]